MLVQTRKGPVYDPGMCRCCGNEKKCRVLNVEYEWFGRKELYSDMLMDCFGLLLSHLDGEPTEHLICATCVSRLREASSFRHQVLECEEKFLKAKILIDGEEEKVKSEDEEEVKEEACEEGTFPKPPPEEDPYPEPADYADHNDNDAESVKSDPEYVPEKKAKIKKKIKVPRKKKARKKCGEENEEENNGDILKKYEEMSERLRQMRDTDTEPKNTKKKRVIDEDFKSFHNTVTIVENTYVCPFDTSFSDYFCIYCREVHTDPEKLRNHTLTHDPTTFKEVLNKKKPQIDITRVDCRLCGQNIDNIDCIKEHLVQTHGKTIYETSNDFLKFKLTITNLSCLECGASFSFFHALKKHMAEHFGTCICDVCGAHYFEERILMLHQRSHQKIDENYACRECGKVFKSKHSRNLHVSRTHKKEPAYQCTKCDEILFSYSLRYRHMIEVHGEQRIYPCESCDRAYDSRKSLREHTRRFHQRIFKHQCDLCDKRFYLPSRLREHLATHTGERNFRCEYCGKSYPRLRGLKVHMQSHSTEKKYKCVLCTASFTQNVNLKNHMKRQHQTDVDYNDISQ